MEKEKSAHYTDREKLLLAQLVSEEKAVDNKKTGATDLKDKADAWERITSKYISEGYAPRSSKQLKKCWDNLKQRKRKLRTAEKHERLMTGGGPALVCQQDPVMDYIDATSANVEIEIDCPFDSTASFERQYNIQPSCSQLKQGVIEINEDKSYIDENNLPDRMESPSPQHQSPKKKTNCFKLLQYREYSRRKRTALNKNSRSNKAAKRASRKKWRLPMWKKKSLK